MIDTLCVFDFDKTLVNTPEKPKNWQGGWWGKSVSLQFPLSLDILNQKVVSQYLLSKSKTNIHTVMMTGRHWGLHKDVMKIMKFFNLAENDVEENDKHYMFVSTGNTLQGKINNLTKLHKELNVKTIEMWEDRPEHVTAFNIYLKTLNVNFKVHYPPDWL